MKKFERPLDPKQFRDAATLLGCKDAYNMCDLDVWNYILVAQGKPKIEVD